jgi:pimeloyl-ACP methyl ester carboxylesterase
MGRPDVLTYGDRVVMTEVMAFNEGHPRLPNVYAYVRERCLQQERWLGALAAETDLVKLVWGTADPVAVAEMGGALAAKAPNARLTEVPGVGHFLPLESPAVVADAVDRMAADA